MIYKAIILFIISVLLNTGPAPEVQKIPEPEKRVFNLINDFRASNGLPRLKYLRRKQWQVDLWAKHISKRFEHANSGYTCENIAYNCESPDELFYQWRSSTGHRRNLLFKRIRYCAVGVYSDGGRYFGVFRGYAN